MKPLYAFLSFCFVLFLLPGCTGATWSGLSMAAHELNIFQNPDINLKAKNYAAADYIIQQGKTFIRSGDVIQLQPLSNLEDPQTPAPIGDLIPAQIGERLIHLGYVVDMSLVEETGVNADQRPAALQKPDFILSGTYKTDRPNMSVGLRITQIKSGRIVGSFDYTMPTNREIRELAKPAPKIMIIKK